MNLSHEYLCALESGVHGRYNILMSNCERLAVLLESEWGEMVQVGAGSSRHRVQKGSCHHGGPQRYLTGISLHPT